MSERRARRARGFEKSAKREDRTKDIERRTGRRKRKFSYQPRDSKRIENRKPRGRKDNWLKPEVVEFRPSDDNDIRFLPPLGLDADHYAIPLYLHYNVGYDNRQYLCRNKMLGEPCPVCEEYQALLDAGEEDAAKKLRPKFYWGAWVIDRNDPKCLTPKFYRMWATLDDNIVALSKDKKSGGYLQIDHPDEGFDVSYEVYREGGYPKTRAVQIARRATAVDEDFLIYIEDNPLPDVLVYYPYEYVEDMLSGKDLKKTDKVESVSDSEDFTEDEIMAMRPSRMELIALEQIKIPDTELAEMSDEELRSEVLAHYGHDDNDQLDGKSAE